MGLSLPHLIILALVVLVLFGRGRISEMMGDFGKGIKSFKQGIAEEANPQPPAPPAQQIPPPPAVNQATLNGETVIDASKPSNPL
ncbi:twin-arginine translocase TatA/TatE family subunit [Novosphingobium sp.]|uniref:twin-arginine translocase TatA/TatE family subunit n=1 Tax=Novosphingobium sp. TaxID=1874826 RepID=UPI002734DFDF|nr:twin-arginine translocase TatA/TatE family subunit [Novosphingobium sp.]MDP3908094.1 twin-arginine translocase TatA/TatE family subunit [Novosphingobium sp.]